MNRCDEHSAIEVRTSRNESDIQTLFSKFGEAISLMYKVDRKLDRWESKVAGISICVTGGIGVIIFIVKPIVEKLVERFL